MHKELIIKQLEEYHIGLKRHTVTVESYRSTWETAFHFLQGLIKNDLKGKYEIHHIGSTALKSCAAKPIIDILLVIDDEKEFISNDISKLEKLGFTHKGEYGIHRRNFFTFYNSTETFDYVHIHAFPKGHEHINRLLIFKEHLLTNPKKMNLYCDFKKNLQAEGVSRKNYPQEKTQFITEILKAEIDRIFSLKVSNEIELKILKNSDAEELFSLVDKNRSMLREWLPWLDKNTSSKNTEEFINIVFSQYLNDNGWQAKILFNGKIAGMFGVHKVDWVNKNTSIGYWLGREYQGNGIVNKCVQTLTKHAFEVWGLNRIEIRCAVENKKSRNVPEKLGFTMEGVLRQAEWVNDRFLDHAVYSLLRNK